MNIDTESSNSYQYKSKQNKYNTYHQSQSPYNNNTNPSSSHHNHPPPSNHKYNNNNSNTNNNDQSSTSNSSARPHSHSHPISRNGSSKSSHSSSSSHRHQHRSSKSREKQYTNLNGNSNYNGSHQPHPHSHSHYNNNNHSLYKSHKNKSHSHKQRPTSSHSHHSHSNRNGHSHSSSSHPYQSSRHSNGSNHRSYYSHKRQSQQSQQDNTSNNVKGSQYSHVDKTDNLSDSEILDLSNHQKHAKNTDNIHESQPNITDFVMMVDKNNHHKLNGKKSHNVSSQNSDTIKDAMSLSPLQIKEKESDQKHNGYIEHIDDDGQRRRGDRDIDDNDDDDCSDDEHDGSSSSDSEFEQAYPLKVIAFDLDKTMVRTISLHTNEQPQPEQHPGGYFMFFDDDTKEYHHVYKRPHLKELLDFLYHAIVSTNKCKMMLCTHGTQKYAQTILERCNADKLFPLMLPRRDWCRRKFEDDYKPRRFKTIEKMAVSVNERVEDVIMIDDDPGVYSKGDRCNGSLVHIKPFDDPYEQRDDTELPKLIKLLSSVLKYGKNYYNKIFANAIRYTGLVKTYMNPQQMAQHSLFRAELLKRLIYDFGIKMNKQERLGTVFLFDRYTANQRIDWNLLDKHKNNFTYYVILMFGCLFIARQYLYTDSKRPKQFRRDPYSAEIWLIHVEIYERVVKKYKTMNGVTLYNPPNNKQSIQSSKHHKHGSHRHNKSIPNSQNNNNNEMKVNDVNNNDNHQQLISYQQHQQHQQVQHQSYHSQSHHRRKRKHKNREKQIYFTELHNIQKTIFDGIEYPKLLHGLYHRPQNGYDSSLFVRYEDYVESLFRHIEKVQMQNSNSPNNPFIKSQSGTE